MHLLLTQTKPVAPALKSCDYYCYVEFQKFPTASYKYTSKAKEHIQQLCPISYRHLEQELSSFLQSRPPSSLDLHPHTSQAHYLNIQ